MDDLSGEWVLNIYLRICHAYGEELIAPETLATIKDRGSHDIINATFVSHPIGEFLLPRENIREYFSRIN